MKQISVDAAHVGRIEPPKETKPQMDIRLHPRSDIDIVRKLVTLDEATDATIRDAANIRFIEYEDSMTEEREVVAYPVGYWIGTNESFYKTVEERTISCPECDGPCHTHMRHGEVLCADPHCGGLASGRVVVNEDNRAFMDRSPDLNTPAMPPAFGPEPDVQ
jgi:hypothetical protein